MNPAKNIFRGSAKKQIFHSQITKCIHFWIFGFRSDDFTAIRVTFTLSPARDDATIIMNVFSFPFRERGLLCYSEKLCCSDGASTAKDYATPISSPKIILEEYINTYKYIFIYCKPTNYWGPGFWIFCPNGNYLKE